VYRFFDRKPTAAEAIARVRFVISKMLASIASGMWMALFVGKSILGDMFSFTFSHNLSVLFVFLFIIIAYLMIGMGQNLIRRSQGRKQRPLKDDLRIMKFNLNLWKNPRQ
jgi:amino acid transporter